MEVRITPGVTGQERIGMGTDKASVSAPVDAVVMPVTGYFANPVIFPTTYHIVDFTGKPLGEALDRLRPKIQLDCYKLNCQCRFNHPSA